MKKILIALIICLVCLSGCSNSTQKNDETAKNQQSSSVSAVTEMLETDSVEESNAKEALLAIKEAYGLLEQFSSDEHSIWYMAAAHEDELSVSYLVEKSNCTEEEIRNGIVYALIQLTDTEYEDVDEEQKEYFYENAEYYFQVHPSEHGFDAAVQAIIGTYIANGTVENITEGIEDAKTKIKTLDTDSSYYDDFKKLYTSMDSFLDYCVKPKGSFEQFKETSNQYRDEIRGYISSLEFELD